MARPQEGLQQRSECPRILHSAVHAHRPRERGGETCHYCRNKSTPFTILRVTSHRMIHCTDGRSGEAMLYSTTKTQIWLGNIVLLGTLLTKREPIFRKKIQSYSTSGKSLFVLGSQCREEPIPNSLLQGDGQFEPCSIWLPLLAALPDHCALQMGPCIHLPIHPSFCLRSSGEQGQSPYRSACV